MFSVMSVCLFTGVPPYRTPKHVQLGPHCTGNPLDMLKLGGGNVFDHVCLFTGGSHYKDLTTCSNLFNLDFTVQGSPAQDMFKLVQLGTSQYRGNPGLVQICSTWIALYKDFLDMFTLRYCVVHTVGKRAVDNQLKCLLVLDLSTT